jgi:hypothetical protein
MAGHKKDACHQLTTVAARGPAITINRGVSLKIGILLNNLAVILIYCAQY